MTTFHFIRHGSHDLLGKKMAGRMPGVHLSDQGRMEAQEMAEVMAKVPLAAIYASPLERAQETAAPLAEIHNLDIHTSDALNEVNFGLWTGMGMDDLHNSPDWLLWNSNRSFARPPEGEMFVEIQSRVVTKVEVLRCAHPDQEVALVSHSDTIRAALCFYLGMPVDLLQRIEIGPASITSICLSEKHPVLMRLNHIPGLV